ncbi:MAG: NAD(P)H-dependent glycerol-3-phosphate dehydrogenase [Planctomycetota bacterium]
MPRVSLHPGDRPASSDAARVAVVGTGAMATVMALILDSRHAGITLFGHDPDQVEALRQTRENARYLPGHRLPDGFAFTADPAELFDPAPTLILNAVPTQYVREVWTRLAPHVPAATPIASVTKGIETTTLLRPTQIIQDALAQHGTDSPDAAPRPLATLLGPTIADELARCLPATITAAADDAELAATLQHLFTTPWFRVYTNPDLLGVELAGATKNVIALAAGILDGLHAGNNAKSALLTRGLAEITRLGVAMGAKRDTFFGLSGVGDLATTCFSPTGRNRMCGEQLGKGKKLPDVLAHIPGVVEGVETTRAVVQLANRYRVEMPITLGIHAVLFEGLDPLDGITTLMNRDPKAEHVG